MARFNHFIGGFYKNDSVPVKFIREAQRFGVNRGVAPFVAKTMNFGDAVVLLTKTHRGALAFAEFTVSTFSANHDVSALVAEKVGVKFDSGGAGWVVRECGSYYCSGSYVVPGDVTLPQMVEAALAACETLGVAPKFFIGGQLTRVYDSPVLMPNVQPHRTFAHADGALWDIEGGKGDILDGEIVDRSPATVIGIQEYSRRTTKRRRDLQPALLRA